MIKRFSAISIVLIILASLVVSIFFKLAENANYSKDPINYFPKDPIFFLGINEITKTFDHFTSTSMIWSKIEDDFVNEGMLNQYFTKASLINDSSFNTFFNNGKTFIGFYELDGITNWLIAKNIFNQKGKKTAFDTILKYGDTTPFYLSYNSPFLTISSSQDLSKSFNTNFLSSDKQHNLLKNKMSFSSQMAKISCVLDVTQFSKIYLDSSISLLSDDFSNLVNNQDWIQFDIDYSPKELKVIGISNASDRIELPSPTFFSFSELVPEDVDFLEKRTSNILLDTLKNESVNLQSIRFKFFDDIQNLEHDILVLETPIDSGQYSKFLSTLTIDSILKTYDNDNLRLVNRSFVEGMYPDIDFKNKYCFQTDYYIMITTISSKKELDYKLARKSNNPIDKSVLEVNNVRNYDQAQSLFLYQNNNKIQERFKNSIFISNPIISSFLKATEGISWTINNFSNRFHHGLVINKTEPKKSEKNILWKVDLPPLSWGPQSLKNHRTGTKDIAVVDTLNKFYLIGANGKIKWTKDLGKPIIGSITQIDAYKNNKYQMVFNTENKLHILDILGNEIDRFPIKFSFKASNQVAVFDYDHNKDYRFILSSSGGKIYNYSIAGKEVNGWKKPKFTRYVNHPLKHFTINGKDYIFSIQNNGKVELLNRKGLNRYKVSKILPIAKYGSYQIKKSLTIDSSSVIFEDTMRKLTELKFGGKMQKFSTFTNADDSLFLLETIKDNELSFYLKNNKELKIIDEGGQTYKYSFPYYFDLLSSKNLNNHTAIFNHLIGEIQLIDSKFRLNPTFFRGSKMLTVDDINGDNSIELLTILNDNILICYQVPKLK